jgi:P-type Mg2+ transporter
MASSLFARPAAYVNADLFWRSSPELRLRGIDSSVGELTSSEAAARLRRYGPNSVSEDRRRTLLRNIAGRIADPLVAILLIAAAISGLSGDIGSLVIIAVVITLSISLDMIQQHRAEALRFMLTYCATEGRVPFRRTRW